MIFNTFYPTFPFSIFSFIVLILQIENGLFIFHSLYEGTHFSSIFSQCILCTGISLQSPFLWDSVSETNMFPLRQSFFTFCFWMGLLDLLVLLESLMLSSSVLSSMLSFSVLSSLMMASFLDYHHTTTMVSHLLYFAFPCDITMVNVAQDWSNRCHHSQHYADRWESSSPLSQSSV